jgi:hypothetical protein
MRGAGERPPHRRRRPLVRTPTRPRSTSRSSRRRRRA